MSGLLDLCNSVKNPVDHAAKLTSPKKSKVKRVMKKPKVEQAIKKIKVKDKPFIIVKSKKTIKPFYSPIWIKKDGGKGRKITSIRFKDGLREKYCIGCNKWKASDTEHFNPHFATKIGLSSSCRSCIRKSQRKSKS